MANNVSHSDHALENLQFVDNICQEFPQSEYRWKTVAAYYTALQLVNAYLADKLNKHPDSHTSIKELINPFHGDPQTKFDQQLYLHYESLEMLSRKARYISQMNFREKHFIEALEHLNELIVFYTKEYPSTTISIVQLKCFDNSLARGLSYFQVRYEPSEAL